MVGVPDKTVSLTVTGPTREWEDWAYKKRGYCFVVGVDEAGRGPLAGPVVAACCYLPEGHAILGINDSKKLSKEARAHVYQEIITHPEVFYAAAVIEAEEIDRINILQATFKAMRLAIDSIEVKADFVLVDGPMGIPKLTLQILSSKK